MCLCLFLCLATVMAWLLHQRFSLPWTTKERKRKCYKMIQVRLISSLTILDVTSLWALHGPYWPNTFFWSSEWSYYGKNKAAWNILNRCSFVTANKLTSQLDLPHCLQKPVLPAIFGRVVNDCQWMEMSRPNCELTGGETVGERADRKKL